MKHGLWVLLALVGCDDGATPEEDECPPEEWWCDQGAPKPDAGATVKDPGKAEGSSEIAGELDLSGGVSAFTARVYAADKSIECESRFPLTSAERLESCAACEFAWLLAPGKEEVVTPGDACAGLGALLAAPWAVGHHASGELYIEKEGAWSSAKGLSEVDGDTWRFQLLF